MCQGCRGSLRTADGPVPVAPFDIAIARAERRSFRDSSGNLITPTCESVSHYHCRPVCVGSRATLCLFVALHSTLA